MGVSLLVLTALILAWEGILPCILLCAAVHGRGFVGRLRRDIPTACELSRGSLETAPSLAQHSMALGRGQNGAWRLLEPSVVKGTRVGLRGHAVDCALRWGACPRRGGTC